MRPLPDTASAYECRLDVSADLPRHPIVDGDTVIMERALVRDRKGWRILEGGLWIRLLEVDTPETFGATKVEGEKARQKVIDWFASRQGSWMGTFPLVMETKNKDSFGRWLGYIWHKATGECLNDYLKDEGYGLMLPAGISQKKFSKAERFRMRRLIGEGVQGG